MTVAHVGDCRPLAFTTHPDGAAPVVCEPWPNFIVATNELLESLEPACMWDDDAAPAGYSLRLTFNCINGSSTYRLVGDADSARKSIWELLEGTYEAMP